VADAFELVRGSDQPFRDVGIADADIELMKADLAGSFVTGRAPARCAACFPFERAQARLEIEGRKKGLTWL
jgi:hypothetical protein